jgi:hypothetical protein
MELASRAWNPRSRAPSSDEGRQLGVKGASKAGPLAKHPLRRSDAGRTKLQMWNRHGLSNTGQPFDSNCLVVARRTELE